MTATQCELEPVGGGLLNDTSAIGALISPGTCGDASLAQAINYTTAESIPGWDDEWIDLGGEA